MKTLDRYIIKKFLGTFFLSLALIIVIAVVFDISEKIDDFLERHAPLFAIVFQYYLNFIPSLEYKLTSSVNFNTSAGYPYQNLRSDNAWWRWSHPLTTWRVGFGWAITRDIYINPYVNFFMESPAFNTASASFNTTFSIF